MGKRANSDRLAQPTAVAQQGGSKAICYTCEKHTGRAKPAANRRASAPEWATGDLEKLEMPSDIYLSDRRGSLQFSATEGHPYDGKARVQQRSSAPKACDSEFCSPNSQRNSKASEGQCVLAGQGPHAGG